MTGDEQRTIVISAGEASGDLHGGNLVAALKEMLPGHRFIGVGGEAMARQGVELLYNAGQLGVTGMVEVLGRLGLIRRALRDLKRLIRSRPAALIVIDYPDFNFRLAQYAHKAGVPVFYYISPQIWAWRTKRVKKIRRWVDVMLVILPFEVDFYNRYEVPVQFVGHPLLDQWEAEGVHPMPPERREASVCLMPGSRENEIQRLLPVMVEAVRELHEHHPALKFFLLKAETISPELLASTLRPVAHLVQVVTEGRRSLLARSRLVITASGTATMEAGLAGTPMIVLYKMSGLTYKLVRRLVNIKYISMVNLLADKETVPELIQDAANSRTVVEEAEALLANSGRWLEVHHDLLRLRARLGEPGASRRAGAAIAAKLAESSPPGQRTKPC
ncbi:lipid-A-disaccharide synthase [bacterium]|nr:lipid-A-disaccharide synthase [candidate division CSSED10-310 bacterium]